MMPDPVANLLDLVELMAREHDGHAPVAGEAHDHVHDPDGGIRVQPQGRLVQKRHLGLLDQQLGDAQPLAHAARKGRDLFAVLLGQPHGLERGVDARLGRPAGEAVQLGHEPQHLPRVQVGVEAHVLLQVADPGLDPDGVAGGVEAHDPDPARGRLRQPQSMSRVVVLPAPLGPRKPKISPAPTVMVSRSTAV
jgi:hypothetical protein